MPPLISVIFPAYNAQAFVAEAVKSILTQTFTDFELIILHDGSSDNTMHVIQQFTNSCIFPIDGGENHEFLSVHTISDIVTP